MSLQNKYAELIESARNSGVANLAIREEGNVLYIDGDAPSAAAKDKLWDIYNKIDPDYRSADMVLNINAPAPEEYEVQKGDNLSKIGKMFGKTWKDIYDANKNIIGDNPDLIQPGWKLKIPS